MAAPTAQRLQVWAGRHEVSVTAAVEHAVRLYLESGRRPPARRDGPRVVVRFRLPFGLHQELREAARTMPAGWSQLVEAAAMGLVVAEGRPVLGGGPTGRAPGS